jgi:hypothetical protein
MLIEPFETDEGGWIIVSNPRPMTAGGVRVNVATPKAVFVAWDWCWSGDGWTSVVAHAERFATHEATQRYIDGHAEMLATAFHAGHSDGSDTATIIQLSHELRRLDAETVNLCEKQAVGDMVPLIRVELDHKWCSVGASGFLEMLQSLSDGAGAAEVRRAIRSGARRGLGWATS